MTAPTIHGGFGYNPEAPEHPGLPIQLEIFNLSNQIVVLDVGMPICQLILEVRFAGRSTRPWPTSWRP